MEVTLGHTRNIVEMNISTIALSHTPENLVMLFRCVNCGTAISQYQGKVIKIYPIVEPSTSVLVVNKCPECGMLYTFQTQEVVKERPIKVILIGSKDVVKTFRCHVCRIPLLKFDSNHIFNLVEKVEVKLPYHLSCPSPDCHCNYYFPEMV